LAQVQHRNSSQCDCHLRPMDDEGKMHVAAAVVETAATEVAGIAASDVAAEPSQTAAKAATEPSAAVTQTAVESWTPVEPGAVYLVGAGPGGLGTLTLRALEVIASCNAVLHDRLVDPEIVRLASPSAEVRYVGKEGNVNTAKMKEQQDDIGSQLVALATQGLSVCRLKGGDPMIYGRVGEEMEQLALAGIPYEIVPAVTAALAAGADARVPLTFRNLATSFRIYTMNATTTRDAEFDWAQFAATSTTYALYMGLSALPEVCKQMMAAGVSGGTPMAVVDRAARPTVQVVSGTVETLPDAVQGRSDLEGPALVFLGSVVGLRERLQGRQPHVRCPPQDPLLALALTALPKLGDEELRRLRDTADQVLERRGRVRECGGEL